MEWTAQWIWLEPQSRENSYLLARRTFSLAKIPAECPVAVSADSRYKLYVNGTFVCRGPVRSGGRYQYYDEVDLAPYLTVGENVVAVLVHHYGAVTYRILPSRAGFLFQGTVPDGRGSSIALDTNDRDWKVSPGTAWLSPVVRSSVALAFVEAVDLEKMPEGWTTPGYDDSDWNRPIVIGTPPTKPWEVMLSRDIPFLTEHFANLQPKVLSSQSAAALPTVRTVDFGLTFLDDISEVGGYLLLFIRSAADREAVLYFAADGAVAAFLDGRELKEKREGRTDGSQPRINTLPLALSRGDHQLLVRVAKGPFNWTLSYAFDNTEGVNYSPDGIQYTSEAVDWQAIGPFDKEFNLPIEPMMDLQREYSGPMGPVRWQPTTARLNPARQMTWEEPDRTLDLNPEFPIHIPNQSPERCVVITVDLGREVTGFPCLEMESDAGGATVDLGYDEVLRDGRVIPAQWVYNFADRVILKRGPQTYESFFWWKAFRYLQITVRNPSGDIKIRAVKVREHHYPAEPVGSFECSDPLLNRIWQTGVHTLRCCMNDAYMDCPSREQALFLSDIVVEQLANFYVFGDRRLGANALRQFSRYQYPNGLFPGVCPGRSEKMTDVMVDQSLAFIGNLWNYHWFTGERDLLGELFGHVENLIDGVLKYQNADGLIQGIPFNIFVDHVVFHYADPDPTWINAHLNLEAVNALLKAAQIAHVLNRPEQVRQYADAAGRIKQGIRNCLWWPEKGVFTDGMRQNKRWDRISLQANTLAVLYGVAEEDQGEHICAYILDEKNEIVRGASPYFYFYIHRMLFKMNQPAKVMANLRTLWGSLLEQGCTTWPETFNSPYDSKCHAYSCTPNLDLSGDILGIAPLEPGFARFDVSPILDELEWAAGKVPTPKGIIEFAWRKENDMCRLHLKVPPSTMGQLSLGPNKQPVKWLADGKSQPFTQEPLVCKTGEHHIDVQPTSS